MEATHAITSKRDGHELDAEELHELVLEYARGEIPDYQMAAFLMAGYLQGLTPSETKALTEAMVDSGQQLDLSQLSGPTADKHSTGGVGDGTSLLVAPLAAAMGLQMVKLSGRGLGHTGGTLDKLEAIPGMRTTLKKDELLAQLEEIGLAICAQTDDLVPADRAMYALRDVTATVDSVALIASSIMSKKLAGGAQTILLDVKTGSGAFMKDLDSARELACTCVDLGRAADRKVGALITDMNQPLSDMVGNAIEVREAIEALRGDRRSRFTELSVNLAGQLAYLAGTCADADEGRASARQALDSGAALERFALFVEAQGGDPRVTDDPELLPAAALVREVRAPAAGWLASVDTELVGNAAARLGAGRQQKDDRIDPAVGLELMVKIGDQIEPDDVIGRVFARSETDAEATEHMLQDALDLSDTRRAEPPLIHDVI